MIFDLWPFFSLAPLPRWCHGCQLHKANDATAANRRHNAISWKYNKRLSPYRGRLYTSSKWVFWAVLRILWAALRILWLGVRDNVKRDADFSGWSNDETNRRTSRASIGRLTDSRHCHESNWFRQSRCFRKGTRTSQFTRSHRIFKWADDFDRASKTLPGGPGRHRDRL